MSYDPGTILDQFGTPIEAEASFTPAFEGASVAARIGMWGLNSGGPNTGASSTAHVRSRSRDLERNNPTTKGALDSFVANMVGTDVSPSWEIDNKEQKEELEELWDDSQQEVDFYGVSSFYGLQELVARSVVRDGEALGRMITLPASMGMCVPLQVQLLEADHLDLGHNDISPDGNEIRFGIEWKDGRRKRYWLWNDHPGDSFITRASLDRTPVDAADMLHVFRPLRAGQARGYGALAPIIVKLHDIDVYDDAEVVRKKAAALWGGFIYSDAPVSNARMGTPGRQSESPFIRLEPGTFPVLNNGQKIAFSQTADVGDNYLDFIRTQFRVIARGIGITYEQLTGDLEGVNYTSLRAGLIEFRRLCETIIIRTLIFQFCRPFINRWTATAVLSGATKTIAPSEYLANRRLYNRVHWHLDGWDFTDPVKDRVAEQMDIRNGIETRGGIIAKRGGLIARIDRRNREEISQAEQYGLVYDCYPGQTTKSGALQAIEDKTVLDAAATE